MAINTNINNVELFILMFNIELPTMALSISGYGSEPNSLSAKALPHKHKPSAPQIISVTSITSDK